MLSAWRAILTDTNRRRVQEMALEGMLEWVVLHRKFSTSVFTYFISVHTVPTEVQIALFRLCIFDKVCFSKHTLLVTHKNCIVFTPKNFLLKFK